MTENSKEIDELIEEQQRELARQYFAEIWENAVADGIDTEIVAEVIIERSLHEIARHQGNNAASRLISHFNELDKLGFLPVSQTLQ